MLRNDARRSAWIGVLTFAVLFAAWYVLTTLTQTISSGRFPAPGETLDALRQIAGPGYADARLYVHVLHSAALVLEVPPSGSLFQGEAVERRLAALGRALGLAPQTTRRRARKTALA